MKMKRQPAPTPEEVMEIGRNWLKVQLAQLPVEDRLKGLKPEDVLSLYAPQERLQGLKSEDILSLYAPQERVKGLKPEDILDQLDPAQIEEYLRHLKRKRARTKRT